MKTYGELGQDVEMLMAELKIRKGMNDDDIAKLINVSVGTIRNRRSSGTMAGLRLADVELLAMAAGYEIKFERKEGEI